MAAVSPTLDFVTGLYLVSRDSECGLVASLLRFEIISATVVAVFLPVFRVFLSFSRIRFDRVEREEKVGISLDLRFRIFYLQMTPVFCDYILFIVYPCVSSLCSSFAVLFVAREF